MQLPEMPPEELERAVARFLAAAGENGAKESDLKQFMAWAEQTWHQHLLLNMVLKGALEPYILQSEVAFRANPDHPVVRRLLGTDAPAPTP